MAKGLSKEAEKKIASLFGELGEKLMGLSEKIMKVFRIGSANRGGIKNDVSGLTSNTTETTNKMRTAYPNIASGMPKAGPAREAPSIPGTTPKGPGDSSTPGLT